MPFMWITIQNKRANHLELTVTTTLVLKVVSVARFITIFIFMLQVENLSRHLRGSVCKSGPVHSGPKDSLPSNFAQ